jgi:YidC/Oxa1 family membrane protein insertase
VLRNALIGWRDNKRETFLRSLDEARRISFRLGSDPIDVVEGDKLIRWAGVVNQFFASLLVVDDQQKEQGFLSRARATLEGAAMKGQVKSFDRKSGKFVLVNGDKGEYEFHLGPRAVPPPGFDEGSRIAVVFTFDDHDRRIVTAFRSIEDTEPAFFNDIMARVTTEPIELKPGVPVVHKYLLYNGPVKVRLLGQLEGAKEVPPQLVERYEDKLNLNTLTDYPSPGWAGDFSNTIYLTPILIKVTNLMHSILWALHRYVPPYSWGLSIIMLTVLVRGAMFPISRKQAQTSLRMQELAPEIKKLQEKYKNDRQALGMAQMELYRKHGVNPLGTCWLLLLQMPIFLGLYYALQESIHFRLAPFWPWISNLAAPDMLFWWSEHIPWISRPSDYGSFLYLGPYFNLLPVVAVALMILQQKLTMPPALDEQQQMQMKMMKYMMIIFGLMFYKVAAGLCIYFIASSLWGFAERRLLPKRKPAPGTPAATDNQGGLFQKLRERIEGLRPGQESSAVTATPPAGKAASEAVTSAVPGGAGPSKRGKKKRRGGRSPEGAPSSGPPSSAEEDGVRGKVRSWWSGLREWWADVLEQARKK